MNPTRSPSTTRIDQPEGTGLQPAIKDGAVEEALKPGSSESGSPVSSSCASSVEEEGGEAGASVGRADSTEVMRGRFRGGEGETGLGVLFHLDL